MDRPAGTEPEPLRIFVCKPRSSADNGEPLATYALA
jgi:hypothetical protein